MVTIDGKGIRGEEIHYEVNGENLKGYLAYDQAVDIESRKELTYFLRHVFNN